MREVPLPLQHLQRLAESHKQDPRVRGQAGRRLQGLPRPEQRRVRRRPGLERSRFVKSQGHFHQSPLSALPIRYHGQEVPELPPDGRPRHLPPAQVRDLPGELLQPRGAGQPHGPRSWRCHGGPTVQVVQQVVVLEQVPAAPHEGAAPHQQPGRGGRGLVAVHLRAQEVQARGRHDGERREPARLRVLGVRLLQPDQRDQRFRGAFSGSPPG